LENATDRKRFYKAFLAQIEEADKKAEAIGRKEGLLLHCCCAPCTSAVLEKVAAHFSVSLYFYNPNIQPQAEYELRLAELKRLQVLLPCESGLLEAEYNPEEFESFAKDMATEPEGGRRCARCFALRLEETAKAAAKAGFPYFATTLTLSPMKDAALLNQLGCEMGKKYGVTYLVSDFKKENGYPESIRKSEKFGLYRQDYCGCRYSKAEAAARREEKANNPVT